MRRTLYTAASVLSLLLCLATVVLWVRSYVVEYTSLLRHSGWEIALFNGSITYGNLYWWMSDSGTPVLSPLLNNYGMPVWSLCVLSAFLPVMFLVNLRRPLQPDHCRLCSYDLTGNTSGVCPECGTAMAGKAGVSA